MPATSLRCASRSAAVAARPCVRAPRAGGSARAVLARATDPAASAKAIEVTDKTFQEMVLDNPLPVLVDFWAPWCGPCRMIAPIVDQVADAFEGQVVCVKLNTDESPEVATTWGIRSIPTVMLFKGGQKLDAIIGAVPKEVLVKAIQKLL